MGEGIFDYFWSNALWKSSFCRWSNSCFVSMIASNSTRIPFNVCSTIGLCPGSILADESHRFFTGNLAGRTYPSLFTTSRVYAVTQNSETSIVYIWQLLLRAHGRQRWPSGVIAARELIQLAYFTSGFESPYVIIEVILKWLWGRITSPPMVIRTVLTLAWEQAHILGAYA